MKKYFWMVSYLLILLPLPLAASTARIYALNKGGLTVGTTIDVIDPATNKIVQTITGIPDPDAAIFSPDGSRAYVSSDTGDALYVVDTKTGKHIKKLALSPGGGNVPSITNDGKRVFVCVNAARDENGIVNGKSGGGAVDIIDTTSLTIIKSLPLRTHDCYTTPDGKYVLATSASIFYVIDVQTEEVVWQLKPSLGVGTLAIEAGPDGSTRRIFSVDSTARGFTVIDFATHKEVAAIDLPDKPIGFKLAGYEARKDPFRVHGNSVSPDGKTMAIASRDANAVFIYSLPDLKLLGYVSTPTSKTAPSPANGGDPGWLTYTPDSKSIYVANCAVNSVSAIDVKTMKVVATIPVGKGVFHVETLVLP